MSDASDITFTSCASGDIGGSGESSGAARLPRIYSGVELRGKETNFQGFMSTHREEELDGSVGALDYFAAWPRAIMKAREVLRNSYVLRYNMRGGGLKRKLLEHLQARLEAVVEALSLPLA